MYAKTIVLLCLFISLGGVAQDEEHVIYGSHSMRKSPVTCIPDSLIGQLFPAVLPDQQSKKCGTITGAVLVEGSSHMTIAGAYITLWQGDEAIAVAITDEAGRYVFPDVRNGTYSVEACRLGFVRTFREDVHVKRGTRSYADLIMGKTMGTHTPTNGGSTDSVGTFKVRHKQTAAVNSQGTIRGEVVLVNNHYPLGNVVVELYQNGSKLQTLTCDENGAFVFKALEDGTYDLNIITDRDNNDLIPGLVVATGKVKMLTITMIRRE